MIHSDHYKNYRGPKLVRATLTSASPIGGKADEDITESIKEIYGPECNWQGCLWTYKEAFGEKSYGKNFKCEFKSADLSPCSIPTEKFGNMFLIFSFV